MSNFFRLFDTAGNLVQFTDAEVTDTGNIAPYYTIEIGSEKSTTGDIKQQIRPGKRFNKTYMLCLSEAKYISLINFITNQAVDYYIHYETAPTLLTSDTSVSATNDFRVSVQLDAPADVLSDGSVASYRINLIMSSIELL
jgi:hypothetical protein